MMKKISYLVLVVLSGLTISAVSAVGFPEAEISNGILHARLYLPDSEKGYYRSTRFDWSSHAHARI